MLPVIVFVFMGLLDLGRAIYTYNTLAQAARQGARTAIVNQTTSSVQVRRSRPAQRWV